MKKGFFIILGHKNPDTDTIVSAIVFSDFLRKKRFKVKIGRAGSLNKETKFLLSFLKEKVPPLIKNVVKKNIILIDHGDLNQAISGAEKANILMVLDHHRIAGLETIEPIFYRCEPLGSTATLIAKIFSEENLKLNKRQASLLLCGIISDTLKFTSPTTTKEDKKIAQKLIKISKINVEEIAKQMFEVKSDLKGILIKKILTKDYKEYNFSGKKVGIGVYETVFPKSFEKIKKKIFEELEKLKKEMKLDLLFFAVVDIFKKISFLYLIGTQEEEIAKKVFKEKIKENIMILPKIVSRKTQIVPPIANILK